MVVCIALSSGEFIVGCLLRILLRNWIVGSHPTESMKATMKLAKALKQYTNGTHYLHLQTVGLVNPIKTIRQALGFGYRGRIGLTGRSATEYYHQKEEKS